MKPDIRAGTLFDAHSTFMTVTGQRYDAMGKRPAIKKILNGQLLPFTKDQLREDVLGVLGGHEDGAVRCRYCGGHFTLVEIAIDHAQPLSRGGELGLDNLDYPCALCNNAKGSLTPTEFLKLVEFLEQEIPLGRKDVLGRLAKAVSLAQGMRSNAPIINDLRKSGAWKQAQTARKERKSGLGEFK